MDLYIKIWNINEEDTELLAVNSGLSAALNNACELVSIIISDKLNDYRVFYRLVTLLALKKNLKKLCIKSC